MFGTGGPIYTLYLARRVHDSNRLRASLGAMILGSAMRLGLFTGSGFYTQAGLLELAFVLLPCALLGYLIGSRLHERLPQALVRRVIWGLLMVSGISLLGSGRAAG